MSAQVTIATERSAEDILRLIGFASTDMHEYSGHADDITDDVRQATTTLIAEKAALKDRLSKAVESLEQLAAAMDNVLLANGAMSKHDLISRRRLVEEAERITAAEARDDAQQLPQIATTYTVWVQSVDHKGTMHVSSHEADDIEAAKSAALNETASDWKIDLDETSIEDELIVVGVAAGDVELIEWNDGDV